MKRDTSGIKFRLHYEELPLLGKRKGKIKLGKGVLGYYPNSQYLSGGFNYPLPILRKRVKANN